jgi:hypothetical protein
MSVKADNILWCYKSRQWLHTINILGTVYVPVTHWILKMGTEVVHLCPSYTLDPQDGDRGGPSIVC